ncbi:MAG TPA: glutamate synthase-related protein, partial [Acidobacteriaceae bacterium]
GRLGPGQMLVVDMWEQKIYESDALLDLFDQSSESYAVLAADVPLQELPLAEAGPDAKSLLEKQRCFGYTREDVRMVLAPMAADGKDAVWSMGDDAPLAALAHAPRPVYGYFRQRFAQVTNPAIDPLREACVVSLHTRIGPWAKLLDHHAPLPGITVESPFLSLGQVEALRQGRYPHGKDLKFCELACVFSPDETLEEAIDRLCVESIELTRQGARILLLTDRSASSTRIPVPMAMATGAVHEALVDSGLRTLTGLTVEAGDCRDVHHAAVLIGYGAAAVCPWLALETARALTSPGVDASLTEHKMIKALDLGLAKIMSKMGISVVSSYRGAHLFDILGLHQTIADRCFPHTPSLLSGIGFEEIEAGLRARWIPDSAEEIVAAQAPELPDFGWIRFRKDEKAESHAWQPATVKLLQAVVGSARNVAVTVNPFEAWKSFSRSVNERPATALRDLMEIRPAGPELTLNQVETTQSMMKRFIASAMSLGSLSPEAHQTVTQAMNMLGGKSNTGEGGEDPDVYRPATVISTGAHGENDGERTAISTGATVATATVVKAPLVRSLLNNKIKQVASARFGVTAEYLAHAEELEIKVAQGAKPGEGGQLPGHKVSELIARLRHAQPGVTLISPPPHHDIYSIEDLAQLIYDLKRVNPKAAVGVKLVSGHGVGTVAAGVAKAYADYIVIAGHSGGTGASPLTSIKYAGNPWELGLAEAQQVLMENGLRGRVRLRTDGGLATARDVLIAALLGADEYAFGTAVLVAIGCDMARQCHLNSCPTGIATQRPELRAKFRGKPEHVVRMFEMLAAELQQMLARYGLPSLEAAIGRVDLLEQVRNDGGLDLTPVLAQVGSGPRRCVQPRNERPIDAASGNGEALDEAWVQPVLAAVEAGEPIVIESRIENQHRAVGARLGGELALLKTRLGGHPHTKHDVTLRLNGTAGQSFGAFCTEGMTLVLDGQANDFVGKGLCGGEILLRACGLAALNSNRHVILGNVALYGATGGALFAAGRAGERFAVRNSGANAVVEGAGDHGCEYMTGGTVVVMGSAGMNFGAGMTGGTAWVLDADGSFLKEKRYHVDFVTPERFWNLTLEEQDELRALLTEHAQKSQSALAKGMLANWPASVQRFLKLTPKAQG